MNLQEKLILFILLVIPVCFIAMHCASSKPNPPSKPVVAQGETQQGTGESPVKDAGEANEEVVRLSRIPDVLRIAYVPSVEAGTVVERTDDLDKALSEKLGIPVKSTIIQNYVMAVEGLGSGQFDCAMLSPLGYVLGKQRYPIEPLVQVKRENATQYQGQIIVNVDSGIKTIADLKGHTFAFVDQVSTSGHLYARVLMLENGLDIMKDIKNGPVFVGSHDKVAVDVMHGTVDAGATFNDVRERVKDKYPEVMEKTRIIALTEPIPNENFSVSSDLDLGFREKLKSALIEISRGVTVGLELKRPFYDMGKIDELVPVTDADYNGVRDIIKRLDFDLLSEVRKVTGQ